MSYSKQLRDLAASRGRNIRIALVGAGQMGRGFAIQASKFGGMEIAVLATRTTESIDRLFQEIGVSNYVVSNSLPELEKMLAKGQPAGTTDLSLIPQLDVDVVVEATGIPEIGAQITFAALAASKNVAVLNLEMDVTIGPLLHKTAQENGVTYTVCRGDEPVEAMLLVDFARDLNLNVIAAGKGKNNPLIPHITPDKLEDEAAEKQMNPRMLCEFVDGSKTMIEMAALSNASKLPLTQRGMIGAASSVATLHETFSLKVDGGVIPEIGMIDYCTGDVAPGVFVVVKPENNYVQHELSYLKMGPGPYFSIYRPFHMASVEAPLSVADMFLANQSTFASTTLVSEVVAMTKRAIKAGETLDNLGGYTMRAIADRAADARRDNLVPIGLLQGAKVSRDIPIDSLITWDDVQVDENQTIVKLRKEMETLGL